MSIVTRGEPYVLVINGDIIDGRHHRAVTQLTHNLSTQRELAYELLAPVTLLNSALAGLYVVKGTEAHVGPSAEEEETLAKELKAIPEEETDSCARYELWLRMHNETLIHFTHHVGTTSSAAYESTAVYKELVEAFNEAGRWGEEPPDMIVRSHRHRSFRVGVPSDKGESTAIVTPGWQLKTPFVFRGTLGRAGQPHVGGWVIRTGDEDPIYARVFTRKMRRQGEVRI